MGITVRHDVPAGIGLGVSQQIGTNQGIGQGAELDQRRAEFLLNAGFKNRALDQQAKEFGVNTALRANEQDNEMQRWRTQLAVTDATQQRQAYQQEANRAAGLAERQMQEEYNLIGQQEQMYGQMLQEQSKTLEQQIGERFKALRGMKLSPEGQRIVNEFSGKHRQIQGDPTLRPDAKQQALGMLMADVERAGIETYEEHVPTAAEEVYEGLVPLQGQQVVPGQPLPPGQYRSKKGTRNGVTSWETLDIQPVETATAAERLKRDMVPSPSGGYELWNPEKKTWEYRSPEKPAAAPKPEPKMSMADQATIDKHVMAMLKMRWEAEYNSNEDNDGNKIAPTKTLSQYIDENESKYIEGLNRRFGDPEVKTLVPSELQTPPGSTMGANIDAPLSIDLGGSPTDFTATNPASGGDVRGAGTEAEPYDLSGLDDETVAELYEGAPSGVFFIDPDDGQLKQKP